MITKSFVAAALWLIVLSACATAGEEQATSNDDAIADLATLSVEMRHSGRLELRESDAPTVQRLRATLRQIDDFRDRLAAYSPETDDTENSVRNDAARVQRQIERARNELPAVARELEERVEAEHAVVARQLELIRERRRELMQGLQMIRAYRQGDRDALRGINDNTIISNRAYHLPSLPNDDQLDRTKAYIVEQLRIENEILGLISQDVEDYEQAREELDREITVLAKELKKAGKQIDTWLRSSR